MEENQHKLLTELHRTNKLLSQQNSSMFQFWLSIVRGIGTAIGITLIGSIVLGILNTLITSVYDVPVLGNIVVDLQQIFSPTR
jgi:hypothetical protein